MHFYGLHWTNVLSNISRLIYTFLNKLSLIGLPPNLKSQLFSKKAGHNIYSNTTEKHYKLEKPRPVLLFATLLTLLFLLLLRKLFKRGGKMTKQHFFTSFLFYKLFIAWNGFKIGILFKHDIVIAKQDIIFRPQKEK